MTKSDQFDVVVIGFGGAGASAAIAAHDAGARVLVLEKAAEGGGNTLESGGTIRQLADWREAVVHYRALTQGTTPDDLLETFASGVGSTIRWLEETLGGELVEAPILPGYPPMPVGSAFPELPGADALAGRVRIKPETPGDHGGKSLWHLLARNVGERGIEVRYDARARDLHFNEDGEVRGVSYESAAGVERIEARGGVVLSCGGFGANKEMHKDFIGAVDLRVFGSPDGNTGDGIKMAIKAGADLWHMNAIAGPFGYRFDEFEGAFTHTMPAPGYIYVDSTAKRFVDETGVDFHACALAALSFDPVHARYPRIPSFVVFDETTRLAGPVSHSGAGWNRRFHKWSPDNSDEIARGWIHKADTIENLADILGLDTDNLIASIASYNRACADGLDTAFHREPEHMAPIVRAPFYAIPLWPCLLNTQGGPRRNARAEIIGVDGKPIAGLFGAGELGSIWGTLYPGAGNVSEALIFGRIAGENAAQLAKRKI